MLSLFVPITKVDAAKRLVYGTVAAEVPDKSGELFDYESSKPNFEKWSDSFAKATDGKSVGNLRVMHTAKAAGKLTSIAFDDDARKIEAVAKVVDDDEWKKVEEGVYSGFSIGGKYQKRWKDGEQPELTRYTADPAEVSLVDNPCIPTATFSLVKADGAVEERHFRPVDDPAAAQLSKETETVVTNEEVAVKARELAKAAGDETKWMDHIEAARAELAKVAETPKPDAAAAPAADTAAVPPAVAEVEQVWKSKDGQTFKSKAEAVKHSEELAKTTVTAPLTEAIADLTAAVSKAEGIEKRDVPDKERAKDAKEGKALPDGSFPIENRQDLKNAIRAYGRAKDKEKAKEHIIARAKALDATDLLPSSWEGSTKKKADKAELADALKKGLDTVARLACLIQELEWLQQSTEWERDYEHDESTVPDEIKEDIANICATLRHMVEEETQELLNDEETEELGELLEMAHAPNGLAKAVEIIRGNAEMAKVADALAKTGARHSKADLDRVQQMHDTSVELGAMCGDADADKVVASGDLAKLAAENAALRASQDEAVTLLKTMTQRVERMGADLEVIKAQPMPGGPAQLTIVSKEDEGRAAADHLTKMAAENPEVLAMALIKASQQQGRTLIPTGPSKG